ncbi:alpha/beta hydrolase [Hutsoniella sourekii]|uniref:alpha/beta hydrolase n=1 Tax=Hutsoniella sourekii TaxID=87650 RepID=UPI000489AA25|nr:alpha/beta fold hydrolase [Hutsoniella sourekii]
MESQLPSGSKFYPQEEPKGGVILFHAYTGTPADVNLVGRLLNRHGYEVALPQFAGHGTGQLDDLFQAGTQDWLQDAQASLAFMKERSYDKLFVFGLSLGGLFATWCLIHEPAVYAGGVFNSPVVTEKPVDVIGNFLPYAQYLYKQAGKTQADFLQDEAALMRGYYQQMQAINKFQMSLQAGLEMIDKPFFIAQSGADEMIEAEDAKRLQHSLPQADVDFNWYPDNTHVITVNRERDQFERDLLQFIDYS